MYVCICNAITDSQIRQAKQNGLTTLKEITQHLGVGDSCGQCIGAAKEILAATPTNSVDPKISVDSATTSVQKYLPVYKENYSIVIV